MQSTSSHLTIHDETSITFIFEASWWSQFMNETIGYVTIAFAGINDSTIITINEEIV